MTRLATCLYAALLALPTSGRAQDASESESESESAAPVRPRLRVAVAGNAPFVIHDGELLEGTSVELWATVATRLELSYDLVPYVSATDAIDAVASGDADVAVGPLSITADRARRVSFTQPYWHADLAILAPAQGASTWERVEPFVSRAFLLGVGGLIIVLFLVGTLLWLVERKANPAFAARAVPGIGEGVWLALVTMTTVGYGDRVPLTRMGRAVTGVWRIFSMVAASSLTAGIATTLTLSFAGLGATRIETADQLRGITVATPLRTTASRFARRHGANVLEHADAASAAHAVASGEADAAVFDRPILQYVLRREPELSLGLSDSSYEPQYYGFALPLESPLRHEISVVLLEMVETGATRDLADGWL